MPKKYTVFVSHAHADNELCDRYVAALREHGLDVWYDRTSMQAGRSLSADIEYELRSRTAFVVLLTPASVGSYWVRLEIDAFRDLAAHDSSRLMLPVRIAECEVPLLLRGLKWIDAVQMDFAAAVDEVSRTLGGTLSTTPTQPAIPQASGDLTVLGLPMDTALKVVSAGQQATSQFLILDGMDLSHRFAALREASKQNEREGQLGKSIDLQQLVIQLQPTSREEWYRLIDLLDRAARYEEQVAACLRLISLDDSWWECDDAGAWAAPGDALVKLGRYAEALPVYEKASGAYRMECAPEIQAWGAEADYDDFPFQERIVTALIGMGNYTRALDICTYIAPPELDEATEDEWDYPIY